MEIIAVNKVAQNILDGLNTLLPQLSDSATALTETELQEIVQFECCTLFVAMENDTVLGGLTLIVFRIPTGIRAWIEDVVVHKTKRGKGIGGLLTRHAIAHAKTLGARAVDLTSNPLRGAANRLYQKVGFIKRETNVYNYPIL